MRQGVLSESAAVGEVEEKSEETSSEEETSAADSGAKHEGSAEGAVKVMLSFLEVSFYLFINFFLAQKQSYLTIY